MFTRSRLVLFLQNFSKIKTFLHTKKEQIIIHTLRSVLTELARLTPNLGIKRASSFNRDLRVGNNDLEDCRASFLAHAEDKSLSKFQHHE